LEAQEQLAARHIALRERAGLTQEQEAKMAGVSPTTISGIESGKITRPHLKTLLKLARALGADLGELRESGKVPAPSSQEKLFNNGVLAGGRRSPLAPWAAYTRRVAARTRSHAADPHSPAFRDAWAALFFVEEKNREAAELYFLLFEEELERDTYDEEPLEALNEVLSAFEELAEALAEAQRRAEQMAAGFAESEIGQARRRAAEAAAQREQAAARVSTRLESRGA
jgi:transcriptional regulator with XRE-family HTH domain